MKKISDFNDATDKYPVVYAGSATRPEFVNMPTTLQQQEGVAPMDTLPAQWWNAMWKLATKDINAFRDYVGNAFTEINNLLTKFGITLEDADSKQLYDFFHNDYVQNYLNNIFVNKSGDTIDGDLHIKGNLSIDGIGEEIISTELKVGANTITLRNGNPSALGNTELAGVVTKNYDGNNHNNIISIDKNGVARTGDIDIATRILYSNNGTNFFTDEELTTPATIGANEKLRDTGNQTSSGVKIYEGITYSNNDTQPLATREENPVDGSLMKWDAATKKLVSAGELVDVVQDGNMHAVTSSAVYEALTNLEKTSHNIPRLIPKDITSYITDGTFWKRLAGTDGYALFEDIHVGDYFKMSRPISAYESTGQYQTTGSQYVTIAGLDTMMYNGDQGNSVNYHHAVMVAGQGFGGTQHFGRSRMNATNTTEGGYKASEMNTLVLGEVTSTGSTAEGATINQQLYAEFGSHLKTTSEMVTNSINATGYNRFGSATGCSNGWEWISAQAILMSEIEVYGSIVWSSAGYDTGNANRQLPLFAFSKQAQSNRTAYWWLKDIASATNFCIAIGSGIANNYNASYAYSYVRPRFIIA